MCTVTSFVSCLFISSVSQLQDFFAPSFFSFLFRNLNSFPFTVRYKHLFISAIYPHLSLSLALSLPGMTATFPEIRPVLCYFSVLE